MNLTCDKLELVHSLELVNAIVKDRSPMDILTSIVINACPKRNNIILKGSDAVTSIEAIVEAEVHEPFEVGVSAKKLVPLIKTLASDNPVNMELQENKRLLIQSGKGEYRVGTVSVEDYPNVLTIGDKEDKTIFAADK